jgi:hypothetical protein
MTVVQPPKDNQFNPELENPKNYKSEHQSNGKSGIALPNIKIYEK